MSSNRVGGSGGTTSNSNAENNSVYSLSHTLNKALAAQSSWPDKEEFLDVIYWLRQIVGVFLGLIWGVIAIQVCESTSFSPESIGVKSPVALAA